MARPSPRKSKKDDARNAFDKALAVDPAQSEVYRQRAMLRFSEGAFDEALSDVRTLIARVPNDAGAHDLEGDILFAKGDLHAAIASYDAAIAIRPSFSNTFLARGVAKYLSSDAPGAIADVKHVAVLAPSNLYAPVWLDIVSARSGVGEPSRLEATLLQLWPAPILNLFSGAIAPEALASLARHEKAVGTDEPCEAVFYTGEWHVIHERTTTGRDLFRKAAQQCPPDFLESWAAQAEIKSIPANQ